MCDAPACKAAGGGSSSGTDGDGLPASIFVDAGNVEVHDVPMRVITRPLQSSVDRAKVDDFKTKIQAGVQLTPIEVAWVERPEGSYYFSFGGCHRWAAHTELGSETIPAKLIRVSPATINTYLGSSSPFRHTAT
ncbi:hypothetical protein HYH02_013958 [Chlamydomonas schloesseri]|uniref:sulfiredoxin n=1 Tax=Chlamydomonas schloesseri TaxID=2026947 RepID=A0A835VYH2_9CHLO|nr:hypothetical protein HYH02_013958 [Chlamydomonas schloesseri]|eukprot:KAG2429701.1 hypothetical protein HYH02_013958 [Chlamydomonas schloesseri]